MTAPWFPGPPRCRCTEPAPGAAAAMPLSGEYGDGVANGIVATPDGRMLIVGDSFRSKIFRVDPATGHALEIVLDPPLDGFLDGIVMHERTLYIMFPDINCPPVDRIQVVQLDKEPLTGRQLPPITGADLAGVANGAIFGDSLYVNNARYCDFPSRIRNTGSRGLRLALRSSVRTKTGDRSVR